MEGVDLSVWEGLGSSFVHWYLSEAAARFLKSIEMFPEAATQFSA